MNEAQATMKLFNQYPSMKELFEENSFRIYMHGGKPIVTNGEDVDLSLELFLAIYKANLK